MNTISIEAAWIIFHLSLTIWPFIEASKFPERCIYQDFGDLKLALPYRKMTLSTLLSCTLFRQQKRRYTLKDILRAGHWLSVMRAFSILSFMLVLLIIFLPAFDKLFVSGLNVGDLVNDVICPTLYGVEVIVFVLRLRSKAIRILKRLHPQYEDISLYSILIFKYIKK